MACLSGPVSQASASATMQKTTCLLKTAFRTGRTARERSRKGWNTNRRIRAQASARSAELRSS
jgi:hypothetical protein